MSNQNTPNFDIDSLLEGTLDDLADMPEFKPFPAGAHVCILSLEQKVVNKHPSFELTLKAVETQELADPQKDEPLKAGAETSILYMLDNEIGQGSFKKLLASAAEKFGAKKNKDLVEDIQNAEALVVTKQRQNKDKTATYTDVVSVAFL